MFYGLYAFRSRNIGKIIADGREEEKVRIDMRARAPEESLKDL